MIARLREAGVLWPAIMTLLALGILGTLGTWQLSRKTWKEKIIAEIDGRRTKPPQAVSSRDVMGIGAGGTGTGGERLADYTRVVLTGRFLHDRERYLFADGRERSGFHVLTPFELSGHTGGGGGSGPAIVWVNRGYIPKRLRDPDKRAQGQIAGETRVVGLVRGQGERNQFTPDNDVAGNFWYWRDVPGLTKSAFDAGAAARVADIAVDAEREPAVPGGWPAGGVTIVKLSNRHLEYAVTWYGLGLTLIGVFVAYARGRLRAVAA